MNIEEKIAIKVKSILDKISIEDAEYIMQLAEYKKICMLIDEFEDVDLLKHMKEIIEDRIKQDKLK